MLSLFGCGLQKQLLGMSEAEVSFDCNLAQLTCALGVGTHRNTIKNLRIPENVKIFRVF